MRTRSLRRGRLRFVALPPPPPRRRRRRRRRCPVEHNRKRRDECVENSSTTTTTTVDRNAIDLRPVSAADGNEPTTTTTTSSVYIAIIIFYYYNNNIRTLVHAATSFGRYFGITKTTDDKNKKIPRVRYVYDYDAAGEANRLCRENSAPFSALFASLCLGLFISALRPNPNLQTQFFNFAVYTPHVPYGYRFLL